MKRENFSIQRQILCTKIIVGNGKIENVSWAKLRVQFNRRINIDMITAIKEKVST